MHPEDGWRYAYGLVDGTRNKQFAGSARLVCGMCPGPRERSTGDALPVSHLLAFAAKQPEAHLGPRVASPRLDAIGTDIQELELAATLPLHIASTHQPSLHCTRMVHVLRKHLLDTVSQ